MKEGPYGTVHALPGRNTGVALCVLVQSVLLRALARKVPRRLAKHEDKQDHAARPHVSLLSVVSRHGPPALLLKVAAQVLRGGVAVGGDGGEGFSGWGPTLANDV